MSTHFKHKDTEEELKFNISSVASGKDILSLTKVLGDMIDGKDSKTEETKKNINRIDYVRENVLKTKEPMVSKQNSNIHESVNNNSKEKSASSNSVDNFRELFSYRKPILLEELEKAHRSLSEEVNPSIDDNIKENIHENIHENIEGNLTDEYDIDFNDGIIENETTKELNNTEPINEDYIKVDDSRIAELDWKDIDAPDDDLKITLELNDIDEFNTIEDSNSNEKDNSLKQINLDGHSKNNFEFEDITKGVELENIDDVLYHENKGINDEIDAYPSTQAILARQRISDLIEEREGTKPNNQDNHLDIGLKENKQVNTRSVSYNLPKWDLLNEPARVNYSQDTEEALNKAVLLEETLANFGVKAQVTNFSEGPTITRFEIQPAPGVKVSRIVNLADDIALCLAAGNVRIEAPIPGKSAVGIEVPNDRNQAVYLKEIIADGSFVHGSSKIMVALGKDIAGKPTVADLSRMPHLLIAGSTGSGKSVCMNSIITSILFRANPDEVKFLMIDPKMVELSVYNGIPHLISPVITDPKKATAALKWVVNEMENRYNLFATNGVRNIESYNKSLINQGEKPLPLVVVLIDELADLMMVASRDVEESICRLAQKARAAGIHLVIATQRPSVDVITGIIKANIPSRIAFAVSSQIDSRTILDLSGAEKLLGRGDMLFSPIGTPKPVRVQGVYVSDDEVEEVVAYWKTQGKPEYEAGVIQEVEASTNGVSNNEEDDELLTDAIKMILQSGQASVSLLQRRFRIGYTRAARLIDLMEERGIIGGYEGSKPRAVLISLEDWLIENGEE